MTAESERRRLEKGIGVTSGRKSRWALAGLALVLGVAVPAAAAKHPWDDGDRLEFQAIDQARAWLRAAPAGAAEVRRFPLGAQLGQCCGGVVTLLFERLAPDERWPSQVAEARRERRTITLASVIDGEQSVIWDEAENRLHAQKGILYRCLT